MSYQSDIFTALTGDATLTGLVGDRVWADVADGTDATPYVVYQVISTIGETTHDGARDIEFPLIQVSAWANTKAESIAVASAVSRAIEGKELTGYSEATFIFDNQQGDHDPETNLFGEVLDYRGACNRN